jgi:hypothetical protein
MVKSVLDAVEVVAVILMMEKELAEARSNVWSSVHGFAAFSGTELLLQLFLVLALEIVLVEIDQI